MPEPGPGARHDHERALRLDELVAPIALLGDDEVDVVRIPLDGIVQLARDAEHREAAAEDIGCRLAGILGHHHRCDRDAVAAEDIRKTQHVLVVGNTQIAASFVLLDVIRVDRDDDLNIFRKALEHAELDRGLEAGEHAARMVVVEKLAAELEVELAAELLDALLDARRLKLNVLLVIESQPHGGSSLMCELNKYSRARQVGDAAFHSERFRSNKAKPCCEGLRGGKRGVPDLPGSAHDFFAHQRGRPAYRTKSVSR